jgi:hypothetical protein
VTPSPRQASPSPPRPAPQATGTIPVISPASPAPSANASVYGISLSADYLDVQRSLVAFDLAHRAGAAWLRFSIDWEEVEPQKGQFDWHVHDQLVTKARADQMNILGGLRYSTSWNNTRPPGDKSSVPATHYPPADYGAWARYVYLAVSRYKADIHYWEVWNEPDLQHFWCGTASQYAHLLAVAYDAIKRADPTAKIVLGGLSLNGSSSGANQVDSNFLPQILSDPAYPAARYFDIGNFHFYGSGMQAKSTMDYVRASLSAAGVGANGRPIWITETGYKSKAGMQRDPRYTGPQGQARWLSDTLPYLHRIGADKVFWFELFDSTQDSLDYGLLDSHLNPKPAYSAFQALLSGRH